jgi:hypothetical protein
MKAALQYLVASRHYHFLELLTRHKIEGHSFETLWYLYSLFIKLGQFHSYSSG